MGITDNSLAYANAASVTNEPFTQTPSAVPRKIVLVGTYDPAKTEVVDNTPRRIYSPGDVADYCGFGSMLHRLALASELGAQGVESWIIPQPEAGGAANASGSILLVGAGGVTTAGTLSLYIGGDKVQVPAAVGDSMEDLVDKVVAQAARQPELPAAITKNGTTPEQLDVDAVSAGPWGNEIALTLNWGFGEETPAGITAVTITAMTGGTGTPDIQDALDAMGTGSDQNLNQYTAIQHGYLKDSTVLDALSTWNGSGDTKTGNYVEDVARPVRSLIGDNDTGSAALTAIIALADGRKLDRTSGIIPVEGSPNHPAEIAAIAMGVAERIANKRPEEAYGDQVLPSVIPGNVEDRWSNDYDDKDLATKSGCSVTAIKNGAVVMQNTYSFYHPDNIPQDSNVYRSMRNLALVQNYLHNIKAKFATPKWQGVSIVEDVTKVSDPTNREKVRDIDSVKDELDSLIDQFYAKGWIFNTSFSKEQLRDPNAVTIRPGVTGFNNVLKLIPSGELGIMNTNAVLDTSISILTA